MNIVITGGATGLGGAITEYLATNVENTVYFSYNKSIEKASALENLYPNTKAFHCDFENIDSIEQFILQIEMLQVDVLVNNAFTGLTTKHFHKIDPEFFLNSFKTNIIPVIKISQAILLKFRKQKSGRVITILSSFVINKPPLGLSEYVANKNYLLSLSKSWAIENARFNITANCISPALMQTDLNSNTGEKLLESMIEEHPLKKLLTVEDVANIVNYFINAPLQINGVNFIVNAASDII